VHADRVPGAEHRVFLAKLGLLHLSDYGLHNSFSRQTRSGGASTQRSIPNYNESVQSCLGEIKQVKLNIALLAVVFGGITVLPADRT
jgi:hypothetical protein